MPTKFYDGPAILPGPQTEHTSLDKSLAAPIEPLELRKLTQQERKTYERWIQTGKPHLAPDLAARLYDDFLNGRTTIQIQKMHSDLSWGSIICARVEYNWDAEKDAHVQRLMTQSSSRALEAQMDAVDFLFELFQITHLVNREAYEKYRKSRNPDDLRNVLKIDTVHQYKELISSLMILAGKPTQIHETKGEHHHTHERVDTPPPELPPEDFLATSAAKVKEQQEAARQTIVVKPKDVN